MARPLQSTIRRPRRSRFAADIDQPMVPAPMSRATIAKPMRKSRMWAISGVQKTLVCPRLE